MAEQSEGNARHKTFTSSYQYERLGGLARARGSREREVFMSILSYEIQGTNMDTQSDIDTSALGRVKGEDALEEGF